MYDRAKEQQKEIATIKERTIHLNLSDADCKRISTYAAKANITVSQLLESFIGDLVNGTYTNGSDERDYAQEWFERCGYGMNSEKTFLRYILEEGADVEFLSDLYENWTERQKKFQKELISLMLEVEKEREEIHRIWLCFQMLPKKEYEILQKLYVDHRPYKEVELDSGISHRALCCTCWQQKLQFRYP